jgi:KUP system potassium uptake protein
LYVDIGHFGTRPIRITWFAIVLPALLLNYFGQGAFLMNSAAGTANPFFLMAPGWMRYPLIALATAAAAIASQAVITGAFSLTMQAIHLGCISRLRVEHTSSEQIGQIYLPTINWALMLASIALVIGFQTSSNLAAAYGVSITLAMSITTMLFFVLLRRRWGWKLIPAAAVAGFFLVIEGAFLGANSAKIAHGGWFPLLVGGLGYILMSTWREGRHLLAQRLKKHLLPLDMFVADLLAMPPLRVPGTAVFMFSNPVGTPHALRHNVRHNKVLHEAVVILCVETAEIPYVSRRDRITVEDVGEGFYSLKMSYGFMEEPNVPRDLTRLRHPQLRFTEGDVSYFLGRETLLSSPSPGLARWREHLFTWMSRNAQTATAYFHIPPDRVFEVGVQIEL